MTGSLEEGESAADAARRELFEETGYRDEGILSDSGRHRSFVIDPRWRNRYAPGVTINKEYEWHFRLETPLDIEIDSAEHSAWQWVSIDEAVEEVWSWTNRDALKLLRTQWRTKNSAV